MSAHASTRGRRPRARSRARDVIATPKYSNTRILRAAALALLVITAICACDVHRNEPIAECLAYAAKVRACFGDRIGVRLTEMYSTPPSDDAARDALRAKCTAGRAQIARTCK